MKGGNKNIVWLASYPKSGNTWFRVFLSNLLSKDDEPVHINNLTSTPIASSRSLFDDWTGVSSADLTKEEIEELRPEVYKQVAENAKETIFHKVHDAWTKTSAGKEIFPREATKGVLYFIRNPLDIAVSFSFHNKVKPNQMVERINDSEYAFCRKTDRIYNQLMQPLNDWSGHVKSWVDDSGLPVKVVRYEDMLAKPFETFKFAVSFLGLERSDEVIRQAIENSSLEKLSAMEEKDGFFEKPQGMKSFFREGKTGTWREYLDKKQISELVDKNREVMERFGYLKDL